MADKKKDSKESKLIKFLKAPIRILIKARDLYIQSMTECSGRITYGTALMGCPTGQVDILPRSFSAHSTNSTNSDQDLRELIRVASTRRLGNKVQSDLLRKQQARQSPTNGANKMPRSHSVAIGRIDEEKECEFEENVKVKTDVYPRSRSFAVTKRSSVF